MRIDRIIKKRISSRDGSSVADLNAALAINVGEDGESSTNVSSHQRIVQSTRDGRTETTISESPHRTTKPAATETPKENT